MVIDEPAPATKSLQNVIHSALAGLVQLDSSTIGVTSDDDGFITLRGLVDSWAQRDEVEHVCWAAAGVTGVDNQIRLPR